MVSLVSLACVIFTSATCAFWRRPPQNEVLELRSRLQEADDLGTARSLELAAKADEAASAEARESDLTQRLQKAEAELLDLNKASALASAELAATLERAKEGQAAVSRVSYLEEAIAESEGEKRDLREAIATGRAEVGEIMKTVRGLQEHNVDMEETVRRAEEARVAVAAQLDEVAALMG